MKRGCRDRPIQSTLIVIGVIITLVIGINRAKQGTFIMIENPSDLYTMSDQYVYFGRETCPGCKLAEKIILSILEKKNMSIYYFDTDQLRECAEFKSVLQDFGIEEVPMIIVIKDPDHFEILKIMDDKSRIDPSKIEQFLR